MRKGVLTFTLLCIFLAIFSILGFVGIAASNVKFVCQVGTDVWMDLHTWEFVAGILHVVIFMFGIIPLILIKVATDSKILAEDNGPIIVIYMITSCFINLVWSALGSFNLWFFDTSGCQVGSYKLYIVSYTMIINGFCILLFPVVIFVLHKCMITD